MRLQTRFVLTISAGVLAVLLTSEAIRQHHQRGVLQELSQANLQRLEAATRHNVEDLQLAVDASLRDAMEHEIKELAQQTAAATEDIKARIAGVQTSTGGAMADIEKIVAVIRDVNATVASIAAAIDEQAAVTKDVAGNIAQASAGVGETHQRVARTATAAKSMAHDIAAVNASVGDIRRGGEQVQARAQDLARLATQLKLQVSQFRVPEHPDAAEPVESSPAGLAANPWKRAA